MLPSVMNAVMNFLIVPIGAIIIRLQHAPIAGRASALLMTSPMTGQPHPCVHFPCAVTVLQNTAIR